MITTLSPVFCLATSLPFHDDMHPVPQGCVLVQPTPADGWDSNPSACMMLGEEEATIWLADHPKWALWKIRCTPSNPPREDDI
jgi:hypothetical protein